MKVLSDILDATDCRQVTLLGLLDLSAAFDTVDHNILLQRLGTSFGLGGRTGVAQVISQLQTAGSDVPWPDIGLRVACVRSTARVCPKTLAVSPVHGRCRDHCQTTRGHCPLLRRRYPAVYQLFSDGQSDICYSATALHM